MPASRTRLTNPLPQDDTPFGAATRIRILEAHLAEVWPLTPASAWKYIYSELLWIDGSTGLAHLYESDKAQEGRPWFRRSQVFTDRLCKEFGGITRDELRRQIDRLFRACLDRLVQDQQRALQEREILTTLSLPWVEADLPAEIAQATAPAETVVESYIPDAALVVEFTNILSERLGHSEREARELAREMAVRARVYFTCERKRQNVLGEGFEDLLELLMVRISQVPRERIVVRQSADRLPGFQGENTRERVESPDISVVIDGRTELLTSVKWSLRHDRQKQLSDELDCYVSLLSQDRFPRYALITNEYDPGRLVNSNGLNRRGQGVDAIYHVNPSLLLESVQGHRQARELRRLIEAGRIRSIEDFLNEMATQYGR